MATQPSTLPDSSTSTRLIRSDERDARTSCLVDSMSCQSSVLPRKASRSKMAACSTQSDLSNVRSAMIKAICSCLANASAHRRAAFWRVRCSAELDTHPPDLTRPYLMQLPLEFGNQRTKKLKLVASRHQHYYRDCHAGYGLLIAEPLIRCDKHVEPGLRQPKQLSILFRCPSHLGNRSHLVLWQFAPKTPWHTFIKRVRPLYNV